MFKNPSNWVVVALLASGIFFFAKNARGNTSPEEAKALVKAGALLLDVRTPEEFSAGHIEGAVNIPVQVLEQRMAEVGKDKKRPVVVYCRSGQRSAKAQSMLQAAGHEKVVNLGAMSRW